MWWWVLIWALLVLLALVYLGSRARGVWGQFKDLRAEVAHASEVVSQLEAQVERLGSTPPTPDVFTDPGEARRRREHTRATLRQERRARQAARRPGWARHLDS